MKDSMLDMGFRILAPIALLQHYHNFSINKDVEIFGEHSKYLFSNVDFFNENIEEFQTLQEKMWDVCLFKKLYYIV